MLGTIFFGSLVLALGIAILVACASQRLAPLLNANQSYHNWKSMLVEGPGLSPLVAAEVCSYEAKARPYHGYYYIGQGPTIGSASRVHVPLDFVARLPFTDRWTERRLLTTSAFALRTDDAGNTTEYVARGRRFCLTLDDDSILARDGYPLNCHVAVHWYVDLAVDKSELWDRLFDNLPHIYHLIRDTAAGFLRSELTKRNYRDAMYAAPQILRLLQDCWQTSEQAAAFRDLVQVTYTGLVIVPREEAERKVLDRLDRGKTRLDEQIKEMDRERDGTLAVLLAEWNSLDGACRGALRGLDELVPKAIESQAESVGEIIVKQQTYDEAIAQSKRVFDAAQGDLNKYSENLANVYTELGKFIRELDQRSKQLLQGPRRTSSGTPTGGNAT